MIDKFADAATATFVRIPLKGGKMSTLADRVRALREQLFENYEDSPFEPVGSKLMGEVIAELDSNEATITRLALELKAAHERVTELLATERSNKQTISMLIDEIARMKEPITDEPLLGVERASLDDIADISIPRAIAEIDELVRPLINANAERDIAVLKASIDAQIMGETD